MNGTIERAHPWSHSVALLGAALVVRLAVAAIIPLFPDETYYWEWSRHLAGGYFDHPAGIAVCIALGRALLAPFGAGESRLAVRLVTVLLGGLASLAAAGTARRLAGDGAAWRAALAITVLPLAAAGLVLATPDAPLLAATSLGVYAVTRALQAPPRSRQALLWWAITGIGLGGAFSSKYTSILLPVGVVIAVLLRRDLRARLAEPGPYVACVVATLVFVPVLVWNAHHDWISFTFQVKHGLGAPKGSAIKREGDLIGGQAGLVSPILFVLMAIAVGRALRRSAHPAAFALATVATFAFAFFVYSATRRPVEANWPAPAYIPGIALLGAAAWGAAGRRWLTAGYCLAGVLSGVVYLHAVAGILPLVPRRDPIARSHGWGELAAATDSVANDVAVRDGARVWIGADRYQDASELAYHSAGQPATFSMNLAGRANQYDLWPGFAQRARSGESLVLALDESAETHPTVVRLAPFFANVERGPLVTLPSRRGPVGVRRIWVLHHWHGGWPGSGSQL